MGPGLDHGVFVPFILMFGDRFVDVPIVQVTIDGSLNPNKEWALGKALDNLRFAYCVFCCKFLNSLAQVRGDFDLKWRSHSSHLPRLFGFC
jgi:hypothetical protein